MPFQVGRIMTERALIESEVDCAQMEPVEVLLVFDSKTATAATATTQRTTPSASTFGLTSPFGFPAPSSPTLAVAQGGGGGFGGGYGGGGADNNIEDDYSDFISESLDDVQVDFWNGKYCSSLHFSFLWPVFCVLRPYQAQLHLLDAVAAAEEVHRAAGPGNLHTQAKV